MTYYAYMLTNKGRTVLQIGVSNGLQSRMWWHWNTEKHSFVKRCSLDRLVYYEEFADVTDRKAAQAPEERKEKRSRSTSKPEMVGLIRSDVRREHAGSFDFARDDNL